MALQRSADDVVDVQHPAGLFRTDAPLVQGEDGALRDDEQAAQLGEPGDHVVGETVGRSAADIGRGGSVDERHHRDRGAARRDRCGCRSVPPAAAAAAGAAATLRRDRAAATVCAVRPACAPDASRSGAWIETLGLEQPGRRRQMLLALANAAAPGERVQQGLVDAPVERRQLRATSPDSRRPRRPGALPTRCSSRAAWQPRKRRRCAVSQPLKTRAAVDLQPVEEVADEQRGQRFAAAPRQASRCPPGSRGRSRSHRRSSPPGRA